MDINYRDITKVEETSGATNAQAYLNCGWVLLNTASSEDRNCIIYSLGWPSEKGEVVTPELIAKKYREL